MTTDQLYTLLQTNSIDKAREIFAIGMDVKVIQDAIKQYYPQLHDVHDRVLRPDKMIYDESDILDEDGNRKLIYKGSKPVQRIAAPFQKQIVLLRSAFIGSPKMSSNPKTDEETNLLDLIGKIWHDNKLDYRFMDTKKRTMSELRCAWLFYNIEDPEYWLDQPIKPNGVKPRVKLLSYELGDVLYPMYDANDDLIAFAREYVEEAIDEQNNRVEIIHFDIYTNERIYYKKKVKGEWLDAYAFNETALLTFNNEDQQTSTVYKQNMVGKIPIIYFHQPAPEWADVQDACARLDTLLSNHSDTNDYFGNPILFGKAAGGTLSLPQKEDAGKYVEATGTSTENADLKFVTWDSAPESIKMEIQNLMNVVYDLSNTANISFENMKGLGPMSGFAIQLMFLGATLKAKDAEMSIFGEGVQRAYNYIKKLISVLDSTYTKTLSFQITPEFASVLPTNVSEVLDNINKAKNAGILSQETAIELNLLVTDTEAEKERIESERQANEVNDINKQKQLSAITKPFPVASN